MNISNLKRYLPILDWLPLYSQEWLKLDLVAGLTTAAVVIPKSMAYAAIAGLPIEVGLYTILVPMFVYALFGSSRLLSVSTTSAIAILTAGQLALRVIRTRLSQSRGWLVSYYSRWGRNFTNCGQL